MKRTLRIARAFQGGWAGLARRSRSSDGAPPLAALEMSASPAGEAACTVRSTRTRLTTALSILGALLALAFAFVSARRGLPAVATVEATAALLMCINLRHIQRAANIGPAALAAIVTSALIVLLGATGTGVQALFWLYTIPMLSYFLLGLRAGVVINLLVTIGYLALLAVAPLAGDPTHAARLDMFFSYMLIGIFAYLYERARSGKELELTKLSNTDALTGAMNRRLFGENLRREIEQSRRYRLPMSLLMIDVDHFKRVNDTCGHECGDRVLRETARRIASGLRQADYFVRYGGEEFCVLAPGTTREQASAMADKIRELMAARSFEEAGSITVSIGVAQLVDDDTEETFVSRADRALYQAKWAGRDRVAAA
ncbi:MAG: GGDEF domain-containing protein [Gammaproteobacteria bacterium]|jgi:diguanylate cyclase (GGDEF)-like protein